MTEFSTSCDCASPEYQESLLALVVQTDAEDYWSKIFRVTNLLGAGTTPNRTKILELHTWLTHFWRSDKSVLYIADDTGEVHESTESGLTSRMVSEGRAITFVWGLSDHEVYAVGDAGVVFLWDGETWTAISDPLGDRLYGATRAVDGSLYVCGQAGHFWRRTESRWQRIELPTNRRLTATFAMPDSTVWVCGEGGALFRGRADDWEELRLTETNLHGICLFKGGIYIAGSRDGVLKYDKKTGLQSVKPTVVSYGLVADEHYMVSFGDKIAIRFNGETWAGIKFD